MKYPYLDLYVACSLTHAPQGFRDQVERLKTELKTNVCNVLCFLGCGTGASPHDIYHWDIHKCVRPSHAVLAICDLPAIGLGYEMGTAVEAQRKPVLAIAHQLAKVSDLVLDPRQPGYEFRRYKDLFLDVPAMVEEWLGRVAHQIYGRPDETLFPDLHPLRIGRPALSSPVQLVA